MHGIHLLPMRQQTLPHIPSDKSWAGQSLASFRPFNSNHCGLRAEAPRRSCRWTHSRHLRSRVYRMSVQNEWSPPVFLSNLGRLKYRPKVCHNLSTPLELLLSNVSSLKGGLKLILTYQVSSC